MIEGGWGFISAAYLISLGALAVLCGVVVARLIYWSRKARSLGGKDS
jgi:hypothetical protein